MIEAIRASGIRVAASLNGLGESDAREPSSLPGWSRAHVVAHLIRSADAYLRLLAVARASSRPVASGGDDLDALADCPAEELADALTDRLDRLLHEAGAMPSQCWDTLVRASAGWRHPAWYVLHRCLRELETHHVDLAVGYGTGNWPTAYVRWAIGDTLATLAGRGFPITRVEAVDLGRVWAVSRTGPVVTGAGHVVLGWLSGRRSGAGLSSDALPPPPAWPLPPTPGWE